MKLKGKGMKLKPIGNRLLVIPHEKKTETDSGILLPPSAVERSAMGTVVSVSEDSESGLNAGNIVLYGKYAGTEVNIDSQDMLIISDSDISAIVE